MLIPDITFAVQVEARQYDCRPVDQNTAVIIPNIRMLESQSYVLGAKSYLTKIMNLATVCRKQGFKPIILNHGGREDANLCSYLSRELGDTAVVQPRDPYLAKAMIGSAGVVVSSRYHGCVAALSQGIPCIATSWTHKYRELFLPFDLDYAVLGVEDAFDCDDERLLRKLFDDCASRVDALGAIRRDLIRRVESFWAVVFSALCRAG
jgi:colanic acid/amylovoran biosynthesis protein